MMKRRKKLIIFLFNPKYAENGGNLMHGEEKKFSFQSGNLFKLSGYEQLK